MKQNIKLKTSLTLAAAFLGLATITSAQTAAASTTDPSSDQSAAAVSPANGLLGSQYLGAAYNYQALHDGGPNHAQGLAVVFNQPWVDHLDVNLGYQWDRTNESTGRLTSQLFDLGGTVFSDLGWGKPFALGAVGWDWEHGATANDSSFFFKLGLGVELPVGTKLTLSPFATYARATRFNRNEADFGVKAEYRVTHNWGLSAGVQYDAVHRASDRTEYSLGLNYHF